MRKNELQLLFCFLSGIFCFLTLWLRVTSYLEFRPLREALNYCPEFRYSCAASVALVLPLFSDVLLDVIDYCRKLGSQENKRRIANESGAERFNFLNISERMLILMGIVVVPLVGFLPIHTENLALIYTCCSKCQLNFIGGAVAISLNRYNKEYWSTKCTNLSLILLSVGLISAPFLDNAFATTTSPSALVIILDNGSFGSLLIPCVLFIVNSSRWLIIVYCRAYSWKRSFMCSSRPQTPVLNMRGTTANHSDDHTFFPMLYTISGTALVGVLCLQIGLNDRSDSYDRVVLFRSSLPFLMFHILISTVSLRMVKNEVVQGLVSDVFCFVKNDSYLHLLFAAGSAHFLLANNSYCFAFIELTNHV